jgi:hypothetical protein
MNKIHLIERDGRFERVPESKDEWESGYWTLTRAVAASLVGGDVYFHSARRDPSHFGGAVLSSRVQADGPFAGRTVLRFRYTKEHRGVRAGEGGWGVEKKIVTEPVIAADRLPG